MPQPASMQPCAHWQPGITAWILYYLPDTGPSWPVLSVLGTFPETSGKQTGRATGRRRTTADGRPDCSLY